ncbi:amino acid ABC transporter substrate-binding protein [Alsobacter sp. SYSU M60028]|uniref:Amino acid ABC transporter substrate-binding protein n=1 Tax=Alsobacter ponti TaxID=2962936 RepID=A0ABT1LEU7_9HYPH|nr:ABC transporter substrate-binding protein [Alsobacter ponti]MCP8939626.1 amino acid ABC transporter substrate-binding protein [Alsobacter ponti]
MTSGRAGLAALAVLAALAAAPALAQAQKPPPKDLRVGYVALAQDARYDSDRAYARIPLRPLGRPVAGAEVAVKESESVAKVLGMRLSLEQASGASVQELAATVKTWAAEQDIHYVVTDLSGPDLKALAAAVADAPVLLLNATAPDDDLRGAACLANVAHTMPSDAMLADALVQYLVARKWTTILALQGSLPEDAAAIAALQRAATRFGAKVVEVRPFQLTNDPRQRDQNNVALLTGRAEYDVVYVADADGEYARYVPYETQRPRPVVGSAGLSPAAWHWAWERNGGPQLTSRFEKAAGRRPVSQDWAAWAAVKAVVQAAVRTRSTDYAATRAYLLGDAMNLDGVKGNPMSFRAWDRQLRQPLFLATDNAIIERAPVRGFLHRVNELDTLGVDEPETKCKS